jgi:hypothetical protein
VHSASRLNPEVAPELDRIISKTLEKDREVRYQHASDLRADLKRLKRDTESGRSMSIATRSKEAAPAVRRIFGRRGLVLTASGAAIVLASFLVLWTRPVASPKVLVPCRSHVTGGERAVFSG